MDSETVLERVQPRLEPGLNRTGAALFLALLILLGFAVPAHAQGPPPVCFWSAQGPVAVERNVGRHAMARGPEALLRALLGGPARIERDQGVWSAIPAGTALLDLTSITSGAWE